MGPVYFNNLGVLTLHTLDVSNGNLQATLQVGTPGQQTAQHTFPTLNKLRRIRVIYIDQTPRLVSFMLPNYKYYAPYNFGVLTGYYTHPYLENHHPMTIYEHKDLKTNYSKLAKTWRRSKAERHQDISNFTQATFNDPDRDLTALVKNINSLIISPKMRQTLWLLITNSLYCGEVAHYYQKEKSQLKMVTLGLYLFTIFMPNTNINTVICHKIIDLLLQFKLITTTIFFGKAT